MYMITTWSWTYFALNLRPYGRNWPSHILITNAWLLGSSLQDITATLLSLFCKSRRVKRCKKLHAPVLATFSMLERYIGDTHQVHRTSTRILLARCFNCGNHSIFCHTYSHVLERKIVLFAPPPCAIMYWYVLTVDNLRTQGKTSTWEVHTTLCNCLIRRLLTIVGVASHNVSIHCNEHPKLPKCSRWQDHTMIIYIFL